MKNIYKYRFLLGFLGFQGFKELSGDPLGLLAFGWFAFFSNYWWCKLGNCEDERLVYNRHRAGCISFRIGITLAIVASILIRLYTVDLLTLYRLQILIISLSFAIAANLWAFLTYKFDFGA